MNVAIIALVLFVTFYGWALAALLGWKLYRESGRWKEEWESAEETLAQARRSNSTLVKTVAEVVSSLIQFSEALIEVTERADLLEVPPEVMAFVDVSWLRIPDSTRKRMPKAAKALAKVKTPKQAKDKDSYFD